jgi:hypothetical protein
MSSPPSLVLQMFYSMFGPSCSPMFGPMRTPTFMNYPTENVKPTRWLAPLTLVPMYSKGLKEIYPPYLGHVISLDLSPPCLGFQVARPPYFGL